jgi:hypothetical protein
MAKVLYSGKTADGKPSQGFVDAGSAREARDKLRAQGLADIVLHQEVGVANVSQQNGDLSGLDAAALAQLAQLRLRLRAAPGLGTVMKEVARRAAVWTAIDVALLLYGLGSGRPELAVIAACLLAYPFARAMWAHRHADRYQELVKSFALGQWTRVAELAAKLRAAKAKTVQLPFDLDIRLAAIRARQGDLAGALQSVEPWRTRLAGSKGLFQARVASIHSAAGDREGFVRMMAESHEASGGEAPRALDLALAQARFGDVAQARALLDALDVSLLPPQGKSFLLWTQGLIAMRSGVADAPDLLGQATAEFLKRATPAGWTALAFCACDHAVALSNAGRKDEARRELAHVWPIVSAHADTPLMQLLQAEGLPPN